MSKIFVANKLQIQGKQTLSAIALILILILSAFMASLPLAKAETDPTYAFINVAPNPVGVGQTALVTFWLNLVPPTAGGPHGDRWQQLTVTVTKPDGTKETLGPFTSDPVGSSYCNYAPTQTGTYTFQLHFPGQTINGTIPIIRVPVNNYYQPCDSNVFSLTVQQQQIQPYQDIPLPLPTQYWQRPIYATNRLWTSIGGNWLMGGYNASERFNPYTTGPNSAHILWTRPVAIGGQVGGGGDYFTGSGTSNYYTGSAYETKWAPPIVINGVLYYNYIDPPRYGWYAVDARTGKQLWYQNGTGPLFIVGGTKGGYAYPQLTMGQIYNYISPNQYGAVQPYLWSSVGTTWYMWDAQSGNQILTINNVPSGTATFADDGSILIYTLGNGWMSMWNSSLAIPLPTQMTPITSYEQTGDWEWRPPVGQTLNGTRGIQWNVTTTTVPSEAIVKIGSGVILATNSASFTIQPGWQWELGYDAATGKLLWQQNRTETPGSTNFGEIGVMLNGIYMEYTKETLSWTAYSTLTGNKVWGPTVPYTDAWGMYAKDSALAYGKFYASDAGGFLHCFDAQTGQSLWTYSTGSSGLETAYGTWPFMGGYAIADGKYYASGGHTHLQPLFRDAQLYAINATDGKLVWSVLGWMFNPVVADGILLTENGYDNQIYAFGQGQSATTVSAPDTAIPQGTPVLIKGTVTDQSPGQTCLGIPAAGTPAISDDSMSAWMEYLYMQQPKPTNATGVPVHLTAMDPNGNYQDIGTVSSDVDGNFGVSWTPPVPGLYKVTATFSGSNSYFSSHGETMFVVSKASSAASVITPSVTSAPAQTSAPSVSPSVAPTPTQPASSAAPSTTLYIVVAAAVIIIVAVAAAVVLRRKK